MKIPDRLINFICYVNTNNLLGTVDVTLPEIGAMTESVSGAGISGELELPTIGHTANMTVALNFNGLTAQNANFMTGETYDLDIRGSQQVTDTATAEISEVSVRVVIRGLCTKMSIGTAAVNAKFGNNVEFSVPYIKLFIDGVEIYEIDKLNFIHKVMGVDQLAITRKNMGM